MLEQEYSIEIIIQQLTLFEDGVYSGLIKFADDSIEVPPFSLPNEFCVGRSITLQTTPLALHNKLASSPVIFEINKDADTFAEIKVDWPSSILSKVVQPDFDTQTHFERLEFLQGQAIIVLKLTLITSETSEFNEKNQSVQSLVDRDETIKRLTQDDRLEEPENLLYSVMADTKPNTDHFASKNYKLLNGRIVRINSDICSGLHSTSDEIQWPDVSNSSRDSFKRLTTCHELFGNRQDYEECQFCRDQLKNNKSLNIFCGDCGGFPVSSDPQSTTLDQSKLFNHHLCVSDCPFDPASSNVMHKQLPDQAMYCQTLANKKLINRESEISSFSQKTRQPENVFCCNCCHSSGDCTHNKRLANFSAKIKRGSSNGVKKAKTITLTTENGQKQKYQIEVEFVGAKENCHKVSKSTTKTDIRPTHATKKIFPKKSIREMSTLPEESTKPDRMKKTRKSLRKSNSNRNSKSNREPRAKVIESDTTLKKSIDFTPKVSLPRRRSSLIDSTKLSLSKLQDLESNQYTSSQSSTDDKPSKLGHKSRSRTKIDHRDEARKRRSNSTIFVSDADIDVNIKSKPSIDSIKKKPSRKACDNSRTKKIKISIKTVARSSGDQSTMKGYGRLRRDGNRSQQKNEPIPPQFKTRKEFIKYMKSKNRGKYSYKFGQKYPGIVIGHDHSIDTKPVPSYMGWLWNIETIGINKIRRGWKPGAVTKTIKEMMQHFLSPYPYDTLPVTRRQKQNAQIYPVEGEIAQQPPRQPTLRVQKKHGEYAITMNPLNDSSGTRPCNPIKFTLAADERSQKMEEARQVLQSKGFTLCKCDTIKECRCRNHCANEMLQCELKYLTHYLALDQPLSLKDLQVSNSDLDIEFTPFSVQMTPKQTKGVVNVVAETQYDQTDYALPSECLKQNERDQFGEKPQSKPTTDKPKGEIPARKSGGKNSDRKKDSGAVDKSKGVKNDSKEKPKTTVGAKMSPGLGKSNERVEKTTAPRDQSVPPAVLKQQPPKSSPAAEAKTDKSVKFKKNATPVSAVKVLPKNKAATGDGDSEKKSVPTKNKTFGNRGSGQIKEAQESDKEGVSFNVLLKDPCNNLGPCFPVNLPCQPKCCCYPHYCGDCCVLEPNLCC